MIVIETDRLILRWLTLADAAFILEFYNCDDVLAYIGDRELHNLEDAEKFLAAGPLDQYRKFGFSLNAVVLKDTELVIGICGLIQRDSLDSADIDIGYGFLPMFYGQGFAIEAARATVNYARIERRLKRLVATVQARNEPSVRLLIKLGMTFEKQMAESGVDLYAMDLAS